jgi:hypothetical protein
MTLREAISKKYGSIHAMARQEGISHPDLYSMLGRRKAASKPLIKRLSLALGQDVSDYFDSRGMLREGM